MQHHAIIVRQPEPRQYQPATSDTVVRFDFERVGVDEARLVTQQAVLTPVVGTRQCVVLTLVTITHEAQNALLKLLEEPPTTTRFVLVVPTQLVLLPTLLSRLATDTDTSTMTDQSAWEAFVAAGVAARLEQVAQWQKHKDSDWLLGIQQGLAASLSTMRPTPLLELVATRLGTRGASNKMLLEALALELPPQ